MRIRESPLILAYLGRVSFVLITFTPPAPVRVWAKSRGKGTINAQTLICCLMVTR